MCRYFEEEDEEDNMAYQPAPGSPGEEKNEESEEEDPLDAFMADIEVKPEIKKKNFSLYDYPIIQWLWLPIEYFTAFFGLEVRFLIFLKIGFLWITNIGNIGKAGTKNTFFVLSSISLQKSEDISCLPFIFL